MNNNRFFQETSFSTIPTVGLSFSDTVLRFMSLKATKEGLIPKDFAEAVIPRGCLENGRIVNKPDFVRFLKDLKRKHKLKYLRVSVPASQTSLFTNHIENSDVENIRKIVSNLLEEKLSLKASAIIFDYQILHSTDGGYIVQSIAIAENVASEYFEAFKSAGLMPLSFEFEGQSIARAILDPKDTGSNMIVDIGQHQSQIMVVTNNVVVSSQKINFGSADIVETLAKELSVSMSVAESLKREQGFNTSGGHKDVFDVLSHSVEILKNEINKIYLDWHDKKNIFSHFPNISSIYLCGESRTIPAFDEYLSLKLKLEVVEANPWANCFSFDQIIPKLSKQSAIGYIGSIGLALIDYVSITNLLPKKHKKNSARIQAFHISKKVFLRCLITIFFIGLSVLFGWFLVQYGSYFGLIK